MRKPAVVVAVAVSAVLVGGVMVATTAGAETTSDTPALPSAVVPDVPAIPQLPADAGLPSSPGLPADALPADTPHADAPPAVSLAPVVPGVPGVASASAVPDDDRTAPTGEPAPSAAGAKPARPGGDRDPEPAGGGADKDKPQRPTFSAAHRDVTSSQALSMDPGGDVQQQALRLVNEHRRRAGCDGVGVDRRLIMAANRHAADMARRGYFAHEAPNGERAGERVRDAGYDWSRYGENIARGQDSVFEVVDGWMHSPEHRENILDCRLREVGLGLAFSADRTPYWVQNFATPQ
ncbi:CAP domain-containing protein [Actinoplanes sp. NPDC051346]|uniref:CAP domain-containing protein n=1 Tax=Actinoplanes sp. NPDC051346 TaxID=3155048 RepID=UPI003431E6BD